MIGTPCYGGQVTVAYLRSLLALQSTLRERDVDWTLKTLAQESLITRARNAIAAEFMGRTDCTHLLFLDADIGFPAQAVLRMLDYDRPVVGCAYPMKGLDWERLREAAENGADTDRLRRRALKYALNLADAGAPTRQRRRVDRGFVEVAVTGTGMMLIRRDAFDRLRQALPHLGYANDIAGYETDAARGNFWLFFDTMKDPDSGRYLSEDFAFCKRWRDACNGTIHCLIDMEVTHFGSMAYRGSFVGSLA